MSKRIESINITPAPMSIASAVELYKVMTEQGKADFVECFNPDDQDLLRRALADAGEILYTPGGLHVIKGVCVQTPSEVDDDEDPLGDYVIETDAGRKYKIILNLPLGDNYVPENFYPKIGQRCIVSAEQIKDRGDNVFTGYAEACWIPKDDEHAKELEEAQGVVIITA